MLERVMAESERRKMKDKKIRTMTLTAILIAITLVLGLTNIGIISIPPANVTTMHIPVIIGALLLGPKTGLLLGFMFGLTSVWKAFTATSSLVGPLLAESPVLVIIMSVLSRLMIPIVAYLVYKMIAKKKESVALVAGPVAGTLTNTVCYLGLMLLFYTLTGINSAKVVAVITGAGLKNGSLEALAAALICGPVIYAVRKSMNTDTKE